MALAALVQRVSSEETAASMESAGVRMVPGAIFVRDGGVVGAWARAVRGRQRVRAAVR
jgi:hypothetical protein